jgi:glycosyltransferase involved in cell wall biosynthesis
MRGERRRRVIRVVYTIDDLQCGGAETMMVRIAGTLNRAEFFPIVLAKHMRGLLGEELARKSIRSMNGGFALQWMDGRLGRMRCLAAAMRLRAMRASVVHSFMPLGHKSEAQVCKAAGLPFVVTLANAGTSAMSPVMTYRLREATAIVAVSESAARAYCSEEALRRKVVVLHNGVDLEEFAPRRPDPRIRRDLGVPEDRLLIACVANLRLVKGHRYLVKAFSRLSCDGQAYLLLVGNGPEQLALEEMATSLGIAHFIRIIHTRGIAQILNASDVFVLPSVSEGCPVALLEAMASGLPCVTTDSYGHEFVRSGIDGLVVPVADEEALADALRRLAVDADLRVRLGTEARATAERCFDIHHTATAHERIYRTLAGR